MNLYPDALAGHLKSTLAPLYCISGDEPLLMQEITDAIRTAAKKKGFEEREVIHTSNNPRWPEDLKKAQHPSLFSSQKIIELRFSEEKMSATIGKLLQTAIEKWPPHVLLIITMRKLDAATKKTKWFLALEKASVFIAVWPIEPRAFPAWITERLKKAGLPTETALVQLLQERTAGNLLAAAQEIEKCALLFQSEPKTIERLMASISEQSRFSVFELIDAALAGNAALCIHVLQRLQMEDAEPVIIAWAFARELRMLARAREQLAEKKSFDEVMKSLFVWPKRQPLMRDYLKRTPLDEIYHQIQQVAFIDRLIKGFEKGNVWEALDRLALEICLPTAQNSLKIRHPGR